MTKSEASRLRKTLENRMKLDLAAILITNV